MIDSAILVETARFERDRRGESYPAKIGGGADAEALTIDFQCWCAIAGWVETGHFFGFHGGAEPERDDAPWISWPELEAAAESALTHTSAKCDRLLTEGEGEGETYAEACNRRAKLTCIHRKVQLRRQLIDSINAELRERSSRSARGLAA
jgi:hypothetical protein